MITVHHLDNSRSQRILWLLEELGLEYEIVFHKRHPIGFAPPELKDVHPLGKAPAVVLDGQVVAESGAAVELITQRYGGGRLMPDPASPDYVRYVAYAVDLLMLRGERSQWRLSGGLNATATAPDRRAASRPSSAGSRRSPVPTTTDAALRWR